MMRSTSYERRTARFFWVWGALFSIVVVGCGAQGPSDLLIRAEDQLRRGNETEALKLLDEAIARKPDFGEALGRRGTIYLGLKQHQQAIKDLSMAIDFLPEKEAIPYHYCRLLTCRALGGDHSRTALEDCDFFLKHHSQEDRVRAEALVIRAWANSIEKQYDQVIQDSSETLANPQATDWIKVEALIWRAGALVELGQYQNAISDCTEAIRINPSHSEGAYLHRAKAYLLSGEAEKANADMATAQRIKAAR